MRTWDTPGPGGEDDRDDDAPVSGDAGAPSEPPDQETDSLPGSDPAPSSSGDTGTDQSPAGDPRAAARALASNTAPDPAGYRALRRLLGSDIRNVPGNAAQDVDDIVDEAVARLHAHGAAGRVRSTSALAYVRRIAHNEAVDRIRGRRSDPTEMDSIERPHADDEIARLIDRRANAQTLEEALRRALHADDQTCVLVASTYLLLAEDRKPTNAAIAERTSLTPQGVGKALVRLRRYISDVHDH